jgi:hypothetical protein
MSPDEARCELVLSIAGGELTWYIGILILIPAKGMNDDFSNSFHFIRKESRRAKLSENYF